MTAHAGFSGISSVDAVRDTCEIVNRREQCVGESRAIATYEMGANMKEKGCKYDEQSVTTEQ